jgi:extracellular factor (EF) 3-hydroxypalmitic acid methyl ester biosynthesis protein
MELRIHHERSITHSVPMEALVSATTELTGALALLDRKVGGGASPGLLDEQRIFALFARWNRLLRQALGSSSSLDDRIRPLVAQWLRDQIQPYILRSSIGYRAIRKPEGYAGDFTTIVQLYERSARGDDPIGELMDAAILRLDAAWAVYHRRRLLADEIRRTHARIAGRPTRVTSLACGPAEELVEACNVLEGGRPLEVTLMDIDARALDHARQALDIPGAPHTVAGLRCNLIHVARGRTRLDLPPQDLIYSAGLIDYLEDDVVVGLMDAAHRWLRPGGRLILGNVHPCNPDRAFMDHVAEWPLIHRTETHMDRLYRRSRFAKPCTRIRFEPQGLNLFAECVR